MGLIQTTCGPSPEENFSNTLQAVSRAADQGAQVLCTQELFRPQYFCQCQDHDQFHLAESVPGPTTEAFSEIAARKGVVIVASVFEKRGPGLYHNTAAIIDADGSLLGIYRKMHIPDDPLYNEKFYFTPGDLGFQAWSTRFGRIGVLICWDQWFPEAARLTAMQGAELLFYPTAIGWHPSEREAHGSDQHAAWEIMQRAHAVANGCFVAAVNRVGLERPIGGDGLHFWGQSFMVAPSGRLLARAGVDREEALIVHVDLNEVNLARIHWPFFRDRRVDAYEGITRRYLI